MDITNNISTTTRTLGDWRVGDPPSGSTWASTTVYPRCQLSPDNRGGAHDFVSYEPSLGGAPLLYCRQCGLVQKLEVLP